MINSSKSPADNNLFITTVNSNSRDITRLLIKSDPVHFLFVKTVNNKSALYISCRVGLSSITIQWLVDAISAKDSVDKHGLSPLDHAVNCGDVDLV
jgi:hypothetical protein